MRHRMAIATLALLGVLLSSYLTLNHYGLTGPLVCGASSSCERVQASRYAEFLGVPVALIGLVGYVGLLVVALAGLQGRFSAGAGTTKLLAALSGVGVAFTAYLTYLELFRIHALCRWCIGSAVIITAIFAASIMGLRSSAREISPPQF